MPQLAELSLPSSLPLRGVQQAAATPPNLRQFVWDEHPCGRNAERKVRHAAPWVQHMGHRP